MLGGQLAQLDFESHSPLSWRRETTAVSFTFSGRQIIVGVTDTSAVRTVTLATALLLDGPDARLIIVKDEGGQAATNTLTVATEGSETIDGSATATITSNYGAVRLYSDGSNWFTW
jgi:hypothetical protein